MYYYYLYDWFLVFLSYFASIQYVESNERQGAPPLPGEIYCICRTAECKEYSIAGLVPAYYGSSLSI
jgi:hypothetical protein